MPMPNTKAPITSDGPIGAIAPPKPGTSAATGTITVAATAISSSAASIPPASPRTRNRRHAAVNENSALRKAAPRPKPRTSSAADAGCPSSATSATSTAVASTAAMRNGQSSRGGAATAGVSRAAILMRGVVWLRPEAELLLQVIPLGARRGKRAAGVGGPVDHRAVIELHVLAAENLGEDEPVRRRPVPGVAIGHRRADRHSGGGERGERGLRLQAIGPGIIEGRAIEIHGTRDVPIGLRGGRHF